MDFKSSLYSALALRQKMSQGIIIFIICINIMINGPRNSPDPSHSQFIVNGIGISSHLQSIRKVHIHKPKHLAYPVCVNVVSSLPFPVPPQFDPN